MKKKRIAILLIILLITILLIPFPHPLKENIVANQIDNATGVAKKVYVSIDGTFYQSILLDDSFSGKFEVEGLDNVRTEVSMRLSKDRETNMNLLDTNEPINRIVQKDRFKEFVITIPILTEDNRTIWNNNQGTTITTLDSMSDVFEFIDNENIGWFSGSIFLNGDILEGNLINISVLLSTTSKITGATNSQVINTLPVDR